MSTSPGRELHAVVPYARTNSSVRARVVHWFERSGTGTIHGPGFHDRPVPRGETTLLLRNARRFTRGRTEQRLLRSAALGIYELDDGLPWDDGRLPEVGRWWKRPWPRALVAERAARTAERVIAGNDVLADWASGRCADVRVIPTCVEPADYAQKTSYEVADRPVIGWLGSPATEHFLWSIAPALRRANERHGALIEVVSGAGWVPAQLAGCCRRVQWTESVAADRPGRWDLGIMPLHDGVYERAKCAYKLLQYAAAGVPAIGSPVGINAKVLAEMDAPAPRSTSEWDDALDVLLTEPTDRRAQRATAGRQVAAAYSYDRWDAEWRRAVGRCT